MSRRKSLVGCFLVALQPAWSQDPERRPVPFVVASPTSRTLYRGITNWIEVAVPDVPCSAVSVRPSSGRVEGDGCSYDISPGQVRELTLYVSWTDRVGEALTDSLRFYVKELPIRAYFAGLNHEDDSLHTNTASAALGVIARVEGGYFDLKVLITGYRLMLERAHQWVFDGTSSEAKLTDAMHEALRTCTAGDMFVHPADHGEAPGWIRKSFGGSALRALLRPISFGECLAPPGPFSSAPSF